MTHNIIQLYGCVPFYIYGKKLRNWEKFDVVQIMNNAGLNSKNIMNNVNIFNDRFANNIVMNNVSYEYSWDEQDFVRIVLGV